jgi:hypothetical protein
MRTTWVHLLFPRSVLFHPLWQSLDALRAALSPAGLILRSGAVLRGFGAKASSAIRLPGRRQQGKAPAQLSRVCAFGYRIKTVT